MISKTLQTDWPDYVQEVLFVAWLFNELPITHVECHREELIRAYGRFLILATKFPAARLVPSKAIGELWCAHHANRENYERFCDEILGLHILPADPAIYVAMYGDRWLNSQYHLTINVMLAIYGDLDENHWDVNHEPARCYASTRPD